MVDIICNICGSNNLEITDRRFCDEGFRSICHSCNSRFYEKTLEELPITILNVEHKHKKHGKHPIDRGSRRKTNYNKALRKKHISDNYSCIGHSYYKFLNQYSKNKIHCSCSLCRSKTRDSIYGLHYRISDLRKIGAKSYRKEKVNLRHTQRRNI